MPRIRAKYNPGTGYHISSCLAWSCVSTVLRSGMISKSTSLSFGRPRQYSGFATITTRCARLHSLYLNGPIPTGSELYATWLMFGYCASRCLGKTLGFAPALEKNVTINGEYGLLKWKMTVYLSGSSTRVIRSQPVRLVTLFAEFMTAWYVQTTSSALNGTPSDHLTPLRKW